LAEQSNAMSIGDEHDTGPHPAGHPRADGKPNALPPGARIAEFEIKRVLW